MGEARTYRLGVSGSTAALEAGNLVVIIAKAIDMAERTSYVVTVRPTGLHPDGTLRFRRNELGSLAAEYEPNPNLHTSTGEPGWVREAIKLANSTLGRSISL